MKKTALISLITFGITVALPLEKFPLWNSTWIIAEGDNPQIFPSAARFRPQKVALIKLNDYSGDDAGIAAEIQYANLDICAPMYSTAEAIDEMSRQFEKDRKNVEFFGRFQNLNNYTKREELWIKKSH